MIFYWVHTLCPREIENIRNLFVYAHIFPRTNKKRKKRFPINAYYVELFDNAINKSIKELKEEEILDEFRKFIFPYAYNIE